MEKLKLYKTVNSIPLPYQAEGFKIYLKKSSGNDIVLSNVNPQTLRFVK
jgi:hypothetical protein